MPPAAKPRAMFVALTGRPVGIATAAPDGFEFLATDSEFELLHGGSFRRLEQLQQAAQSLARALHGEDRSEVLSVPFLRSGTRGVHCSETRPRDNLLR